MGKFFRRHSTAFINEMGVFVDLAATFELSMQERESAAQTWLSEHLTMFENDAQNLENVVAIGAEDAFLWSVRMPSVFRSSIFVSAYFAFEHFLTRLCNEHAADSSALRIGDLRGDSLERAALYMKKVARVDFPSDSPEWSDAQSYRQIRNVVAHHGSVLIDSARSKSIVAFRKRVQNFRISNNRLLYFEAKFVDDFVGTAICVADRIANLDD